MKTILLILHDCPPIRTAGTERVLKFAQYLPEFGYRAPHPHHGSLRRPARRPSPRVYRAATHPHALFAPAPRRDGSGSASPDRHDRQPKPVRSSARPSHGARYQAGLAASRRPAWTKPDCPPPTLPDFLQFSTRNRASNRPSPAPASSLPWVADLPRWLAVRAAQPCGAKGALAASVGRTDGARRDRTGAAVIAATAPITDDLRGPLSPRSSQDHNPHQRLR